MRVLILGGTALTGPHIVRELHAAGHHVAVFHRGKTTADLPAGVEEFRGDAREILDHAATLRAFSPEVVVHMVTLSAQDAWGCLSVFRGAARRVVAISSQDVYGAYGRLIHKEEGPPDPVPLAEDSPLRTRLFPYRDRGPAAENPYYEYDKILVERLLMSDPELPGTILRYPMVYGPGDKQHRLFSDLKRMDDGRPAILMDESIAGWRWTRGYSEDMAHAVFLAITKDEAAGRVYNVGEEGAPTQREWTERIGRACGWGGRVVVLPGAKTPKHLANEMNTAQQLVTDTRRIRRELGYSEPTPPEEALRRTIEWERANPPAQIDPAAYDYAAEDAAMG
jgi:nucleoside-diphosphate-sugar epimerase